jgi:hypothetical protein
MPNIATIDLCATRDSQYCTVVTHYPAVSPADAEGHEDDERGRRQKDDAPDGGHEGQGRVSGNVRSRLATMTIPH